MGKVGGREKTQKGENFNLLLLIRGNRLTTFDNNGLNASKVLTKSHLNSFTLVNVHLKLLSPVMHEISFGSRALPGPAGGVYSAPQTPSCIKGCLLQREERGEEGMSGGGKGGICIIGFRGMDATAKQCNLVLAKGRWCCMVDKAIVTMNVEMEQLLLINC